MEPTAHPLFFASDKCPDFSTQGNDARPMKADSQVAKLLKLLCQGHKVTIADIRVAMRSENAKARLSEARVWLAARNIEIQQEWHTTDGVRYLKYWLEPLDCVAAWDALQKVTK
jgi:hypothetical protein